MLIRLWFGKSRTAIKVTATRYLIASTTWPLYQGAGSRKRTRSEESVCKWSHKSSLGLQGRGFDPRKRRLPSPLFRFNLQTCYYAYSEPVSQSLYCVAAIAIIDECLLMFHFRNIAGWQKDELYLKKIHAGVNKGYMVLFLKLWAV